MVAKGEPIRGDILDERIELTLREVCQLCGAREETVVELIREGIVEPMRPSEREWMFSGIAVTRIQTALRLQQDLDINPAGAALALELLDEINRLKRRLGE